MAVSEEKAEPDEPAEFDKEVEAAEERHQACRVKSFVIGQVKRERRPRSVKPGVRRLIVLRDNMLSPHRDVLLATSGASFILMEAKLSSGAPRKLRSLNLLAGAGLRSAPLTQPKPRRPEWNHREVKGVRRQRESERAISWGYGPS